MRVRTGRELLTELGGSGVDALLAFGHERGGRVGASVGRAWTRHSMDGLSLENDKV